MEASLKAAGDLLATSSCLPMDNSFTLSIPHEKQLPDIIWIRRFFSIACIYHTLKPNVGNIPYMDGMGLLFFVCSNLLYIGVESLLLTMPFVSVPPIYLQLIGLVTRAKMQLLRLTSDRRGITSNLCEGSTNPNFMLRQRKTAAVRVFAGCWLSKSTVCKDGWVLVHD